ncbi:hypothetical protein GCM10027052_16960 [Parafrigoribacterium mesophilum]|uniref:DUF2269 family protein n=1 Tax=Parafrigoribacterium mesophilum TaxID=433646 RepID=UPI0031FC71BA
MGTLLNILHVVTAVFIVGPMAILPMTGMRAIRAGNAGQVLTLAKSTFVLSLASLAVVIFGFGAMSLADERFNLSVTTPWILISIVLYIIALIVSLAMVVPIMRRAGRRLQEAETSVSGSSASAADGGPATARSAGSSMSEYSLIGMSSGISAVLLLVVVILMVWKP